ncbi:AAA family ATPase [Thiorhodococcus minor]|uniref:AAA family ATPase n=1 Tax=Thiorhodococcus minor TaxID=57489 RepID=A0A6M0K5E0_9GAMM|nr:AAA family ATPase [Thiorhodococcus minor]NEV63797.1 AAA family ATPase [Thiorhodococcus minor]
MYESFYGFDKKPFSLMPEPAFLFMTEQHKQALTVLEYGLSNQVGFIVLTGEIGAGKTTLAHYLFHEIDDSFTVGFIRQTHQSFGNLMDWVSMAFGLECAGSPHEILADFTAFLIQEYAAGRRVLLILDEAQNLSSEQLEQLRLLSNINADQDFVMQIMLLGQPGLRDLLREPSLEQFAQRIAASFHLGGMSPEETQGYIHHRILAAGSQDLVFTPEACAVVHRTSKGLPRLVNLICDTALVYGYGAGALRIDAALASDFIDAHLPYLLVPIDATKAPQNGREPAPQPQLRQIAPASRPSAKLSATRVVHIDASTRVKPPAQLQPALQQRAGSGQERTLHAAHAARWVVGAAPIVEAPRESESFQFDRQSEHAKEALETQPGALGPMTAPMGATTAESAKERSVIETTDPGIDGAHSVSLTPASEPTQADADNPRPLAWQRIMGTGLILVLLALGIIMGTLPRTGEERAVRSQDRPPDDVAVSASQEVVKGELGDASQLPEATASLSPVPDRDAPTAATADSSPTPGGGDHANRQQPDASTQETEPIARGAPADLDMNRRSDIENRGRTAQSRQQAATLAESRLPPGTDRSDLARSLQQETSPASDRLAATSQDLAPARLGASVDEADSSPHPAVSQSTSESAGPSQDPATGPPSKPRPEAAQRPSATAKLGAEVSADQTPAILQSIGRALMSAAIEAPNTPAEPPNTFSASSTTQALEQRLSDLSERIRSSGANQMNIDLGRFVLFPAGSEQLNRRARETLSSIASILSDYEAVRVRVIAYTDSPGSAALNLKLSQRRAERVSSFLTSAGIAPSRLEHEGRGESQVKVAPADDSERGIWANRRIELELTLPALIEETSPGITSNPETA